MGAPVTAVVLTHRRPRLATQVVRGLIEREGLAPDQILVVVNGEGGLADPRLAAQVHVLPLPHNLGPAGGYAAGLRHATARFAAPWLYVCEDDVGLFELPAPRLEAIIQRVQRLEAGGSPPVGGVVAFGRQLDPRTGVTVPHVPVRAVDDFDDVDLAVWGASLVSRRVVEAGILPDPDLFFGFEDFDFWLRVRRGGFRLLLDNQTSAAVADRVSYKAREQQLVGARPVNVHEPWRQYYNARNFFVLRRRYGHLGWTVSHLLKSARRLQLAPTLAHRRAILYGLRDGFRGRVGIEPRFTRTTGEWTQQS